MGVRFLRRGNGAGRLHVGYRLRDWRDVWFEPDESAPSGSGLGLHTKPYGEARLDDPLDGEVAWHPPFDPKHCESRSKPEQRKLQKDYLVNGYTYCSEKSPEEVLRMEHDLNDPSFRRWHVWFTAAKTWKKKDLRTRKNRRTNREKTAHAAGLHQSEVDINSDSSDEDEIDGGYVSGEERRPKRKANETGQGGSTPQRPRSNANNPYGTGSSSASNGTPRGRPTTSSSSSHPDNNDMGGAGSFPTPGIDPDLL